MPVSKPSQESASVEEFAKTADIVLAPTFSRAEAWNRTRAAEAGGLFGTVAETFLSWYEALWEREGNGARPVDFVQRLSAAEAALAHRRLEHLSYSPHLAKTLADCARYGSGIPSFDEAIAQADAGQTPQVPEGAMALDPAETELLACIADYHRLLNSAGLIETGTALAWLSRNQDGIFDRPQTVAILGNRPLPLAQRLFLDSIASLEVIGAECPAPAHLGRVAPADLTFAFPAGRYAQAPVLLGLIDRLSDQRPQGRIALAAKDPLDLYRRLSPALTERGMTCAVRGRTPLANTDFGRAFQALRRVHASEQAIGPWDRNALCDVLRSSFFDLPLQTVWKWDRRLRGDRLANRDEVIAELRGEDSGGHGIAAFRLLDDFATGRNPVNLDDCLQRYRDAGNPSQASSLRENRAAVAAIAQLLDESDRFGGLPEANQSNLIGNMALDVAQANYPAHPGEQPHVIILSQKQAAELIPGSVDALIVCDQTTDDYPLVDKGNAVDTLLEKTQAQSDTETPLARSRREFSDLMGVPATHLILERCLNGPDASELYPSAMMEELVDAYRDHGNLTDMSDLDGTYRLPACLRDRRVGGGEDNLLQDVRPGMAAEQLEPVLQPHPMPGNALGRETDIAFPFPDQNPDTDEPILTPSQLDTFRDCPYLWFASSRLGITTIDEETGPAEIGDFMHQLFQHFYRRFGRKVEPENLSDAQQLMFERDEAGREGVFDEVCALQAGRRAGERLALLPGTTEQRRFDELRRRAADWLGAEADLLPGFTPVAFEYPIEGFSFGGCSIRGRIDRIDIDRNGRAVIIDYKGAMRPEYRPLALEKGKAVGFNDHAKIQGLVYAAALQQAGTLHRETEGEGAIEIPIASVVGALYVSYKRGNKVSGAYRTSQLSAAADIPRIDNPSACGLPDAGTYGYPALMEQVESQVARAGRAIRAGAVAPAPSHDDACKWCPLTGCGNRRIR